MRGSFAKVTDWHGVLGAAMMVHIPVAVCFVLVAVLSGELDHPAPVGAMLLFVLLFLLDTALWFLRTRLGRRIAAELLPADRRRSLWLSEGDREDLWFRARCGRPYPLDLHVYCDETGTVHCDCFDPNQDDHIAYRPWTVISGD